MSFPDEQLIDPFYFAVGRTYALTAYALILGGVAAALLRSPPSWLLRTLQVLCWLLLGASLIVMYAYAREFIQAYYSESVYERAQFKYRMTGPHAWVFWLSTTIIATPQAYWIPACRRKPLLVLLVATIAVSSFVWEWWLSRLP